MAGPVGNIDRIVEPPDITGASTRRKSRRSDIARLPDLMSGFLPEGPGYYLLVQKMGDQIEQCKRSGARFSLRVGKS